MKSRKYSKFYGRQNLRGGNFFRPRAASRKEKQTVRYGRAVWSEPDTMFDRSRYSSRIVDKLTRSLLFVNKLEGGQPMMPYSQYGTTKEKK